MTRAREIARDEIKSLEHARGFHVGPDADCPLCDAIDPIDAAIAATDPAPVEVEYVVHRYTIPLPSSQRVAFVELPMDSSDAELMEAAAGILLLIHGDRERERAELASPIVVATRMPQ